MSTQALPRKRKIMRRRIGASPDPSGHAEISCLCGIRIRGYRGDPEEWMRHHRCTYPGFYDWGGWPRR